VQLEAVRHEVLDLLGHGNKLASRIADRDIAKSGGKTEAVLTVLRARFQDVSGEVAEGVRQVTDPNTLDFLIAHAATCQSLGRFTKALNDSAAWRFSSNDEREHFTAQIRRMTEVWQQLFQSARRLNGRVHSITMPRQFFFRESEHFDFFKSDILPWMVEEHAANDNNDLRIWCAAASSGEEAYSLMMTLLEYFGADYKNWRCGLLATDISEKALTTARSGIYAADELEGVPQVMIDKYFKQVPEGYAVIKRLKKEVIYRRFNLMEQKLPFKKRFDCIWCRNVMIYFDNLTKHELVNRMYHSTVNGGYLLIGHSETLDRNQTKWEYVKPGVYRKSKDVPLAVGVAIPDNNSELAECVVQAPNAEAM